MNIHLNPFHVAYIVLSVSFLIWLLVLFLLDLRERRKNEKIFRKLMERDNDEPPYAF